MTRQQLEAVIEALAEVVSSWNDGKVNEGRGHGLCLTLYEDGSGRLGMRSSSYATYVQDTHTFGSFDGLCRVLEDGEGVAFDEEEE